MDPASPLASGELREKVLRSGGWTLARMLLIAILQAATLVVLLRLLRPEDFGVISIVTVVLMIAQAFSQTGVDLALVREPGEIDRYLGPYFTLQVVRGIVLGGIIALLARPIAIWQETPALVDYLLVASAVPVLEGLRSVSPILFSRALEQRRPAIVDAICSLLSFSLLVILVAWLRSPWAIVWNQVASTLIRSLAFHLVHPVRARFTLAWGPLRRFFRFGIGFNLAQSSRYLVSTVDRLIIGRHLGMHTLGIYDRSHALAHYGLNQLPVFISSVVFPGFSRVLADPPRFRRLARRFLLLGSLAGISAAGAVRLFDTSLLTLAAGETAPELLPFFRVLLLLAALRWIALLGHALLDVLGRPQVQAVCNCVQAAWLIVALPLAVATGELSTVCAVAVVGGVWNAALMLIAFARVLREDGPARGLGRVPAAGPAELARAGSPAEAVPTLAGSAPAPTGR